MNSVQTIGAVWLFLDFVDWISPKPINKASKKVFSVKANKVNTKEARAAITRAKQHQRADQYDFTQKEILQLEENIQKILNSDKLSGHTIKAVNDGLYALQIMKDALEIDPQDVLIYLREMYGQMQFLIKKGI